MNKRGGIPVCANESLHGCRAFKDLIDQRATEFVHFDLCVCGGITEGLKIAAVAEAHDLPISLHAANTVCLFSASIHFAASVPNCDSVENHQVHRWLSDYAPVATMAPKWTVCFTTRYAGSRYGISYARFCGPHNQRNCGSVGVEEEFINPGRARASPLRRV